MACDIGRRSAPCGPTAAGLAAAGLAACTCECGCVRTLCTAAALAAALSAAALTASSRTAYASRRCVLLSSERRLSNEGELTPWEGKLTETDGRLLRWPACTSRLAGLHPEPLGRLLRGGGVLQDVREALVGASSLRGRACRGTGGLSVPRLVCPA